jgi:hypothetical protein
MIRRLCLEPLQPLLDQRARQNQLLHLPCVPRTSILTPIAQVLVQRVGVTSDGAAVIA